MEADLLKKSIAVSAMPAAAYHFSPPAEIITTGSARIPLRNIFDPALFSALEKEKLLRLKTEIAKNKLKLPPKIDDSELMRVIHGSSYKTRKAYKALKEMLDTYQLMIPNDYRLMLSKVLRTLSTGFFYIHGRDKYFRPTMILDIPKIDLKRFAINDFIEANIFVLEFALQNLFIPGKVENWVNVVEMGRLGMSHIPIKSMLKLTSTLQKLYKCRLAHSINLNPPSSIYYIWALAKPFIDKVTQDKVQFEKGSESELLKLLYSPSQLEVRFGGQAPNVTEFWPPTFPKEEKESSNEISNLEDSVSLQENENINEDLGTSQVVDAEVEEFERFERNLSEDERELKRTRRKEKNQRRRERKEKKKMLKELKGHDEIIVQVLGESQVELKSFHHDEQLNSAPDPTESEIVVAPISIKIESENVGNEKDGMWCSCIPSRSTDPEEHKPWYSCTPQGCLIA